MMNKLELPQQRNISARPSMCTARSSSIVWCDWYLKWRFNIAIYIELFVVITNVFSFSLSEPAWIWTAMKEQKKSLTNKEMQGNMNVLSAGRSSGTNAGSKRTWQHIQRSSHLDVPFARKCSKGSRILFHIWNLILMKSHMVVQFAIRCLNEKGNLRGTWKHIWKRRHMVVQFVASYSKLTVISMHTFKHTVKYNLTDVLFAVKCSSTSEV